ncbi:MAG TPA: SDR family NAD(P)-dependent oxidoreductase [Terriglobales bacterium]
MSNFSLENKVAVVTGGGRGIGAAIAHRLAALGAAVAITGRSEGPLNQTAESIRRAGGQCQALLCDVSQWQQVQRLSQQVKSVFGGLNILVNNAGVGGFSGALHELSPEEWERILNTNLRGAFYCMKAFTPLLIAAGRGDIVNISSIASKNPLPNGAAYAASKWGLNGLSYSAAEELRKYKIRVSIVCPGSTNTELSPHEGKNPDKMLRPEDVANLVGMIVSQPEHAFTSEIVLRPTEKP